MLKIFENSIVQNGKALLQELTLGDQKPSVLLRKMTDHDSGQLSDYFLKKPWLQRLLNNIQTAVSCDVTGKLAVLAVKVSEISVPHNDSIIAETSKRNAIKILCIQISELSKKLDELTVS